MGIARKAVLTVAVPALAAVVFAGFGLASAAGRGVQAQRVHTLAEVGGAAAGLAHELQLERIAVAGVLTPWAPGDAVVGFGRQVERTRQAEHRFQRLRAGVSAAPRGVAAVLARVDAALRDLDAQRRRTGTGGSGVGLSTATFAYRILVADLVSYREAVAQSGVDPVLADQIRAAAALSRAKEAFALQQTAVVQALALGELTPASAQEVVAARTANTDALGVFNGFATPEWRALLGRTLTGERVLAAQRLEGAVSRAAAYQPVVVPGGVAGWNQVMGAQVELLRQVEVQVDTDITTAVLQARDDEVQRAAGQAAGLLTGLLFALLITVAVVRSMAGRLRLLQQRAMAVAYTDLPGLVADLRDVTDPRQARRLVDRAAPAPVSQGGRDEIGQVTAAFAHVHSAAVRIAGDEASLRAAIGRMFVTIGRRVQRHVERAIADLDGLEKSETDPTLLEKFFRLDQQITGLRRFVNTLLILAGGGLGDAMRQPQPLYEIVRGAQSEVTDYQRISVGEVIDCQIAAHAVHPVVHILAELLDNATVFSPPDTNVLVSAVGGVGGVLVSIDDTGVGIDPDRMAHLNELLAAPAPNTALTDQMGLAAVARAAVTLGITVRLHRRARGGTTATVLLPAALLYTLSPPTVAAPRTPTAQPATVPASRLATAPTGPASTWPGALSPGTSAGTPGPSSAPPSWPLPQHTQQLPHTQELPQLAPAPAPAVDPPMFLEVAARPAYRNSPWLTQPTAHRTGDGPAGWRTSADPAWQAAQAAAHPVTDGTTGTGLPRRRPDAHLITPPHTSTELVGVGLSDSRPERVQAQVAAALRGLGAARRTQRTENPWGANA